MAITTKRKKGPTLIQRSRAVSPSSKALFNHGPDSGGTKRVYRKFFGLSAKEEDAIETFLGRRIDINLQRSTA